ncbi:uncharacterized protein [Physcomitrium patens]|uniref:uncharacterized protein n=1 Tax=Physcomitrium patens TaxID=3218 RepID=UPI003CCE06E2
MPGSQSFLPGRTGLGGGTAGTSQSVDARTGTDSRDVIDCCRKISAICIAGLSWRLLPWLACLLALLLSLSLFAIPLNNYCLQIFGKSLRLLTIFVFHLLPWCFVARSVRCSAVVSYRTT